MSVPGVFLRRPLSIFGTTGSRRRGVTEQEIEFLYRVVGPGTGNLATLKAGTAVTVLGPLGTGYNVQSVKKGETPVLVAGGTGIASLAFLADRLPVPGVLFYGGRSNNDLVALDRFTSRGWLVNIATEDGSRGHRGYITDLFKDFAAKTKPGSAVVFACGPRPMLEKVAETARKNGLGGCVSLEEMMACGVGNCQGCAVSINGSYKMVCKDGPVFDMREIDWS